MSEHDQIDEKTIEQLYEEILQRLKAREEEKFFNYRKEYERQTGKDFVTGEYKIQ